MTRLVRAAVGTYDPSVSLRNQAVQPRTRRLYQSAYDLFHRFVRLRFHVSLDVLSPASVADACR